MAEAVCALLCAGWLMGSEVPELRTLHQLFTAKYGKAYSEEVMIDSLGSGFGFGLGFGLGFGFGIGFGFGFGFGFGVRGSGFGVRR